MVRRSTAAQPRPVRRSGRIAACGSGPGRGRAGGGGILAALGANVVRHEESDDQEEASSSAKSSVSSSSSSAPSVNSLTESAATPPPPTSIRARRRRSHAPTKDDDGVSSLEPGSSDDDDSTDAAPETPAPERRDDRADTREPEESSPSLGHDATGDDEEDTNGEIVAPSRSAKPKRRPHYLDEYDVDDDDSAEEEEEGLSESEFPDSEDDYDPESSAAEAEDSDDDEEEIDESCYEEDELAVRIKEKLQLASQVSEAPSTNADRKAPSKSSKATKSGSAVRSKASLRKTSRSRKVIDDESSIDDEPLTIQKKTSCTTKTKRSAPISTTANRVAPVKLKATRAAPTKGIASAASTRRRRSNALVNQRNGVKKPRDSLSDHSFSDHNINFDDNDKSTTCRTNGESIHLHNDGDGCTLSDDGSRSIGSSTASEALREENENWGGFDVDEDTESEQSQASHSPRHSTSKQDAAAESPVSLKNQAASSLVEESNVCGDDHKESDESVLVAQVLSDDEDNDDDILTVAEVCDDEESATDVPDYGIDTTSCVPKQTCHMELSLSQTGAQDCMADDAEFQPSPRCGSPSNGCNGADHDISGPSELEDDNHSEFADNIQDGDSHYDSDYTQASIEKETYHEAVAQGDISIPASVFINSETEIHSANEGHSDENKFLSTQETESNETSLTVVHQVDAPSNLFESAVEAVEDSFSPKILVSAVSDTKTSDAAPETEHRNEDQITSQDTPIDHVTELKVEESEGNITTLDILQAPNDRVIDSANINPGRDHWECDEVDKETLLAANFHGENGDVYSNATQQTACVPVVAETLTDEVNSRVAPIDRMDTSLIVDPHGQVDLQKPLSSTSGKQEIFCTNPDSASNSSEAVEQPLPLSLSLHSKDGVTYNMGSLEALKGPARSQCLSSASPSKFDRLMTPAKAESPSSPPVSCLVIGKDLSNEVVSPLAGPTSDASPMSEILAIEKDELDLHLSCPAEQEPTTRSLSSFPRMSLTKSKTKTEGKENGHAEDKPECKDTRRRREGSVREWKRGAKIGTGAFGDVHVCMNMQTGGLLAVKIMKVDESMIKDARREINFLRCLTHKNIVRYYGAENVDGRLHIFQEWVAGGSISGMLARFGSFSLAVIRNYLCQALEGLSYLHDHRIMHRDIKGANILVSDQGVVKLADFGASKRLSSNVSLTHTMRGTPYFMAPEVFEEKYSLEADIWSIGCVAFQMFTARPPWKNFGKENPVALFNLIRAHEGPPPMDLPSNVSEADGEIRQFQGLLAKSFQRDPKVRPSAREMLSDPFIVHTDPFGDDEHTVNRSLFSPYSTSSVERFESPSRPSRRSLSRANSTYHIRSPLLSPPVPRRRSINASSPLKSPKVDSSEWPTWARHRRSKTAEVSLGSLAYSASTCQSSGETSLQGASIMP